MSDDERETLREIQRLLEKVVELLAEQNAILLMPDDDEEEERRW
ncbi:MAG TPA: hypothetical protein PK594_13525 [Mycobacterium sp.]|nr:hypothetical protein [Mycobacterium sp.]